MPELPDLTVYLERLAERVAGRRLAAIRLLEPFLLRSAVPPIAAAEGRTVVALRRLGKRIVISLEGELHLVLHLMIAGRLRWVEKDSRPRNTRALLEFENGTLAITEAGTRRRASLHLVAGETTLQAMDPGGADLLTIDLDTFGSLLKKENHTLKRALTDPRILDGIGNAYSDEILHRARLSPLRLTSKLADEELARLLAAARSVLTQWTERLRADVGEGFPEKVTAFREGMAVHGRYRQPCPDCGAPVQRIAYRDNETNYCARCQTEGRLLADRALSRLLKQDWPKTIDELER